jgi:hypothetical protein
LRVRRLSPHPPILQAPGRLVLSDISRREPLETADSWEQVSPIIDAGKGMISAMEQTSLADESLRTNGFDSLIE